VNLPLITKRVSNKSLAFKCRFKLDDIRATLDEFSSSGLPGDVEPKAVDSLILITLKHWDTPVYRLVDSLEAALRSSLENTLEVTALEWSTSQLFFEMRRIQESFLSTHLGDLRSNIASRALRLERRKPMTMDEANLQRYMKEQFRVFEDARFEARSNAYFDTQERVMGKEIPKQERERKRLNPAERESLKLKLGPDPFTREIEVMAKIRAYYQIASTRFVDNIRQSVEAELFYQFRDGLKDDLEEGLKVTEDNCKS